MLRAALLGPDEVVRAWHAFKSNYDIEAVYPNSVALLPLLYQKLSQLNVQDELMGKLKGVYRRTWYKNQMLLKDLAPILQRLHDAGVQTMLTDACSLAVRYYSDSGLRNIENFHILVPSSQIVRALETAEQNEMKPYQKDARGRHLIIHPYLMRDHTCEIDVSVWEDAVPFSVEDTATSILGPEDQLLSCLLSFRSPYLQPCLWVADVMTAASCKEINWEKLSHRIHKYYQVQAVSDALNYMESLTEQNIVPVSLRPFQDGWSLVKPSAR